MDAKMYLRIITKNHAAYPEIGSLIKSISKPYGRATAMPPAWFLVDTFLTNFSRYLHQKYVDVRIAVTYK